MTNQRIICEAVLDYYPDANLIVKVNTQAEKSALEDIKISTFVHAEYETAALLVKQSLWPVLWCITNYNRWPDF